MTVASSKTIHRDVDGVTKRFVECELYADTVPSPLPTAEDIPGFTAEDQIFVGSTLYIVSTGALYMADEDGEFVEQ